MLTGCEWADSDNHAAFDAVRPAAEGVAGHVADHFIRSYNFTINTELRCRITGPFDGSKESGLVHHNGHRGLHQYLHTNTFGQRG